MELKIRHPMSEIEILREYDVIKHEYVTEYEEYDEFLIAYFDLRLSNKWAETEVIASLINSSLIPTEDKQQYVAEARNLYDLAKNLLRAIIAVIDE